MFLAIIFGFINEIYSFDSVIYGYVRLYAIGVGYVRIYDFLGSLSSLRNTPR